MAGGTVPSGTSTYTGSLTATSTAESTTFADRYGYVVVKNLGTSPMWATADGSTPTGSAADSSGGAGVAIPGGATEVLANGLDLWFQSSKVIPAGVNQFGGNTTPNPGAPGMVQSQTSLAGQMSNPGTKVTVIGTASTEYSIEGTG